MPLFTIGKKYPDRQSINEIVALQPGLRPNPSNPKPVPLKSNIIFFTIDVDNADSDSNFNFNKFAKYDSNSGGGRYITFNPEYDENVKYILSNEFYNEFNKTNDPYSKFGSDTIKSNLNQLKFSRYLNVYKADTKIQEHRTIYYLYYLRTLNIMASDDLIYIYIPNNNIHKLKDIFTNIQLIYFYKPSTQPQKIRDVSVENVEYSDSTDLFNKISNTLKLIPSNKGKQEIKAEEERKAEEARIKTRNAKEATNGATNQAATNQAATNAATKEAAPNGASIFSLPSSLLSFTPWGKGGKSKKNKNIKSKQSIKYKNIKSKQSKNKYKNIKSKKYKSKSKKYKTK